MSFSDVIIIGGGAAGLFCAGRAGQAGLSVTLIEHSAKLGEKIRISGGGRCNFTNIHSGPKNFLSQNPHFAKSALARYMPQDFIALVNSYDIAWHEKTLGQLFCDGKATQIIDMLKTECAKGDVNIRLNCEVKSVQKTDTGFTVETSQGQLTCKALVIATGGLSIPKIGASSFGYRIAQQFGLPLVETRAGLVPLTLTDEASAPIKALSGLSHYVRVRDDKGQGRFDEAMLLTHRGLSGPAILQISSYWREGEDIHIDLIPDKDGAALLLAAKKARPKSAPATVLSELIPERLAQLLAADLSAPRLGDMKDSAIEKLAALISDWTLRPAGSEGYRTAEVTLGGVDTRALSSKTMEARAVPGLYFIGEVVDVTGHLGGHNFQWAWASAAACAEALRDSAA